MPVEESIKPYTGSMTVSTVPKNATPEQAAAIHSDAAVKFSEVFQDMNNQIKKGQNPLDEVTRTNLEELKRTVRKMGYKHATVFNLTPFKLEFGASVPYLGGIVIPPCAPGQLYAKHCIRHWKHESEYNEDGSRKFKAILPIHMAGEFVREYGSKDNYGGGIIICEGDVNPENLDKFGPNFEVETYDAIGRPVTITQPTIEYDQEGNPVQEISYIPVKRRLHDLLETARKVRNEHYKKTVARMSRDWSLPEGRGKFNVTEVHRTMAAVLMADGELAKLPEFCTEATPEEAGLSDFSCKACGAKPRAGAYKCVTCGNILNALEAYKDFAIEFEHAKMSMLTSDEMEEAQLIQLEREEAKKPPKGKAKGKE